MNYLRKVFKPIVLTITFIVIAVFITTLLNYFNILNYKLTIYLKFITSIISFFIGGLMIGYKSKKKGWLEGIKFSLIIISFMIIITLLLNEFEYKSLIFYNILLISSIIGSMFGITKNKDTK